MDQILEYREGKRDRMQVLRDRPAGSLEPEERLELVKGSIRAHAATMIDPYPRFRTIRNRVQELEGPRPQQEREVASWSRQLIRDCQIWSTLTWFGFDAREQHPELNDLINQGGEFSRDVKEMLGEIEDNLMETCIDRWKQIHADQPVELSVNPYYHPIGPLITNYHDVEEALPDAALPERSVAWPEDARWHLREARRVANDVLGIDSPGLWPSEGSISPDFLDLVIEEGFAWAASDQALLSRSDPVPDDSPSPHLDGYSYRDKLPLFFRDTRLSDRIGFDYARMDPDRAVDEFLNAIRQLPAPSDGDHPVPVILDGENPWEYFSDGGRGFLGGLYERLETGEHVQATTPSGWIERSDRADLHTLSSVGSGSWIYGNFAVWAGHELDVRAWDLLAETREALNGWRDLSKEIRTACFRALYGAQASDWFWWYGEPFSSRDDDVFDQLFRQHLIAVYERAGRTPPSYLYHPMQSGLEPQYEPPRRFVSPIINGKFDRYREWWGAAIVRHQTMGTMARVDNLIEEVRLGSDETFLYGRVQFDRPVDEKSLLSWTLNGHTLTFGPLKDESGVVNLDGTGIDSSAWAYDRVVEWKCPLEATELKPGEYCNFVLRIRKGDEVLEQLPYHDTLTVPLLDRKSAAREWTV